MDRIEKALQKLTAKERKAVKEILRKVKQQELQGLDVKKLKGRKDVFRVREGDIRIMYRIESKDEIFILAIERRSEKTYKSA